MERVDSLVVFAGLVLVLSVSSWLLGRAAAALGVRVPSGVRIASVAGPCLFLLPFLLGDSRLGSTDLLTAGAIPGTAAVADAERYLLINDPPYQFTPWEAELRRLLKRPGLAFWSDRLEGGSSLWANPQAQVLSPVAWIARLFPLPWFFLVKIAAQSTVCFLGVWVLARRLGASSPTSLAAACAATLSGGMIPWALFPHTGAAAWVPWTTAGLVVLARRPNRRAWLVTSTAVAALLASGHPEVAFGAGVAGGFVGLALRARRVSWRRLILGWGSVAVVGFALASPALLPFLAALPESQRAAEMTAESVARPSLGWHPKSWFLESDRRLLLAVAHPDAMGVPFQGTFRGALNWLEAGAATLGIWTLAGAVLALFGVRRAALPLIGFGGFAVLAAAGFEPLVWGLRHLPPFTVTAFPRLLLVGSILLSVASALGWDAVRRRRPNTLMLAALFAAGVASVLSAPEARVGSLVAWSLVGWLVWVGEAPDGRGPVDRRRAELWAGVGLALVVFSLVPWAWRMLPTSRPETFYPSSPVFEQLAATAETSSARPRARVLGTDYLGYPSLLSMYGLAQTRPHNPMTPAPYLDVLDAAFGFTPGMDSYFAPVQRLSAPWLDFLGIAAVWSTGLAEDEESRERRAGLERAGTFGPFGIWRNPNAAPPWQLASRWQSMGPGRHDRLRSWDPTMGFLVDGTGPTSQPLDAAPGRLVLRSYRPGRIGLDVVERTTSSTELLVTSLQGPSGWSVRWSDAEGRTSLAERVRVQGAFLGAWIPPDAVRLEMRYVPPGWGAGILLCGLAAALWIGTAVRARRRGSQVAFSSG